VQYGIDAGLDVDAFAPRISFFFNAHSDFFEEIAKFRAAAAHLGAVDARRFGAEPALVAAALHRRPRACR
jgi:methylmalonyl-CoA mutase N-terminal domain/subunit